MVPSIELDTQEILRHSLTNSLYEIINSKDHLNPATGTRQKLREVGERQTCPEYWLPVQVKHFAHIS